MTDTYLHIVARITPAIFGVRLVLRMVNPYLTRICAYNAASYTPMKTPTTLCLTKRPRTPPPSHHRSSCPPRSRWGWKVSLFILETSKPVHASARISPSPPFPRLLLGAGFALFHVCGSSRRVCGKLPGGCDSETEARSEVCLLLACVPQHRESGFHCPSRPIMTSVCYGLFP